MGKNFKNQSTISALVVTREELKMKLTEEFTVDLTKIEGDGDFLCPRCGSRISPDDESEEVYTILEPRVDSRGLEEVVIRCNRCSSKIQLKGFSSLDKND